MLSVSDEGAASDFVSAGAADDELVFATSEAVLLVSDAEVAAADFIEASDDVLSAVGAVVAAEDAGFVSCGLFSLQDATPAAEQLRTATASTLPNLFTSFLSSCLVEF
jgi:hypothetical protein